MSETHLATAGPPVGTAPVGTTHVRAMVAVQLYTVAAYVAAAVVPYLWRGNPVPPAWMWIVPAWLLGVPGFWITVLGPVLTVPLALIGAATALRQRRALSARLRWWCVAAIVSIGALAVFGFTPLGQELAGWVAD